MAKDWGSAHHAWVYSFPADWETYGKAAGPIRNTQMLTEGNPDMVAAFHNDISKSKGTKNMIVQAKKAGIKVILLTDTERKWLS
jgi:hypothetical protein